MGAHGRIIAKKRISAEIAQSELLKSNNVEVEHRLFLPLLLR
jgi:hypothetical protein